MNLRPDEILEDVPVPAGPEYIAGGNRDGEASTKLKVLAAAQFGKSVMILRAASIVKQSTERMTMTLRQAGDKDTAFLIRPLPDQKVPGTDDTYVKACRVWKVSRKAREQGASGPQ